MWNLLALFIALFIIPSQHIEPYGFQAPKCLYNFQATNTESLVSTDVHCQDFSIELYIEIRNSNNIVLGSISKPAKCNSTDVTKFPLYKDNPLLIAVQLKFGLGSDIPTNRLNCRKQ